MTDANLMDADCVHGKVWYECKKCECPFCTIEDLLENLRAYIKLVYPEEMTPQAKRILEQIIERHQGRLSEPENR